MSEDHQRLEQTASAIEDLLYMGAIRLGDRQDKALLSPQFSLVASNVMSSMKIEDGGSEEVMKLMYYSLLIYMNEYLKVPKPLMVALGNDLEKNRDGMEAGGLVTTYVAVLAEVWSQNRKQEK
ncbi:MAG TPA: hypothetical protein VFS46_04065 [Nitrososphaera sp.]|nr:hypothetical protein [Nitrososphaera sp.]